jgi:hypothetical protein
MSWESCGQQYLTKWYCMQVMPHLMPWVNEGFKRTLCVSVSKVACRCDQTRGTNCAI